MRNIKVTVEYDGTNYHGFQRQTEDLPTIQQVLEEVIALVVKHPITITGAGRTDAGVHAKGQVINFKTDCHIPIDRVVLAMNSLLPSDIAAKEAEEVPVSFNAQRSAKSKIYRYSVYNSRVPSAFERLYSYYVPQKLDIDKMKEAAVHIVGEHDFSAFRAAGAKVKTSVRRVYRLDIEQSFQYLHLTIEANGFLYNMVRIIVGTLLYVGKGKLTPDDVIRFVNSGKREDTGPTVPPQGLALVQVNYGNY
jgi:tRNA pseudouridine38-40 synthase